MDSLAAPPQLRPAAPGSIPPELSAWAAQCRYVDDRAPGIRRVVENGHIAYFHADGGQVRDEAELRRIASLAIPPAWRDVWICPTADGHLQATGRDARGRKQYRYHPRFREAREETKFQRALDFAAALPRIRRHVDRDLRARGMGRDKVLATLVRLLEITLIRIGNEEYARVNGSFGLTTMRGRHLDIAGSQIRFRFRGKSGKVHEVSVQDARLARILQRCSDLPGEELFQYVDDAGDLRTVQAADVNEYLRRIAGADFSTKDFRTWAGTVLAAQALRGRRGATLAERKRTVNEVVRDIAARLGNTPAVCRKCYIHPEVMDAYLADRLDDALGRGGPRWHLSAPEGEVRRLLQRSIALARKAGRAKQA